MPRLTVDGQPVQVPDGATVLDAARQIGVEIPTLCHLAGGDPPTSCFVCVVQVAGRPRLSPSCAALAEEGMVVTTDSPDIRAARKMALELLLSDHAGDCSAPCRSACPAGTDIQWMNHLIAAGREDEAREVARRRIVLPGTIGRVCPRFCERACRRGQLDEPIAIGDLHAQLGEKNGSRATRLNSDAAAATGPESGKRVAVVGAGPAGMAAAFGLRRAGHAVTIFEAAGQAGGALRRIEPARLPAELLDAEIAAVLAMGCELRTDSPLGPARTLAMLRKEFDAAVLAIGAAGASREMLAGEGLAFGPRGLTADRASGATAVAGVFAAGELVAPTGNAAIRAVAGGHAAAAGADQFLRGRPVVGEPRPIHVRLGKLDDGQKRILFADRPPAARDASRPAKEAARCLMCGCAKEATCRLRHLATAWGATPKRFDGACRPLARDATHPEIVYESGKCIQCGICVRIAEREKEALGLTFIGRGFVVRTAAPFSKPLAEALARTARQCAAACPTGALALKDGLEADRADEQ